jgi:hypothetical protein
VRTYGARVTGLGRAGKIFWPKWEQAQKPGRSASCQPAYCSLHPGTLQ